MKICIVPTNGILIGVLTKSKIEIFKTKVLIGVFTTEVAKIVEFKTIEELKIVDLTVSTIFDANLVTEGCFILIDEVVDTSISDVLSYEVVKSDWMFDVSMVVTIKPAKAISKLDDVASFARE